MPDQPTTQYVAAPADPSIISPRPARPEISQSTLDDVAQVEAKWDAAFADIEDPAQNAMRRHLAGEYIWGDLWWDDFGDRDVVTDEEVVAAFEHLYGDIGGARGFLAEAGIDSGDADA